jgi:adenylate cyclase
MDDRDVARRDACRDPVTVSGVRPETGTVLFTDVAGSTAWRAAIGDPAADVRMTEWAGVSRDVVAAAGGTVAKDLGDGVFPSAAAALDAAVALQRVAASLLLGGDNRLRVGVSSGDMSRVGDDWYRTAAIEASRLCEQASGGTVLVGAAAAYLARGRSAYELRSLGSRLL